MALARPSGAGRSVVTRLLLCYADPNKGHIHIGDVDLHDMQTGILMRQLSFVSQDNFPFVDMIANNTRLGAPGTPLEAVIAVIGVTQVRDFISALLEGYDTWVGERRVLPPSGQRRHTAIARALLQDRPILMPDEATAFADPENGVALTKVLVAVTCNRTVIMVAHHLPMVTQTDVTLLFPDGQSREMGNHTQLSAQGGPYQRFWQRYQQAQYWVPGGAQEGVAENRRQ